MYVFLCLSRRVFVNEIWGQINIYTNDDPVFCRVIMSLIKEDLIYNFTYYTPYTPLKILTVSKTCKTFIVGHIISMVLLRFTKFITVVFLTYLQNLNCFVHMGLHPNLRRGLDRFWRLHGGFHLSRTKFQYKAHNNVAIPDKRALLWPVSFNRLILWRIRWIYSFAVHLTHCLTSFFTRNFYMV